MIAPAQRDSSNFRNSCTKNCLSPVHHVANILCSRFAMIPVFTTSGEAFFSAYSEHSGYSAQEVSDVTLPQSSGDRPRAARQRADGQPLVSHQTACRAPRRPHVARPPRGSRRIPARRGARHARAHGGLAVRTEFLAHRSNARTKISPTASGHDASWRNLLQPATWPQPRSSCRASRQLKSPCAAAQQWWIVVRE